MQRARGGGRSGRPGGRGGALAADEEIAGRITVPLNGRAARKVILNAKRKGRPGAVPLLQIETPAGGILVPFGAGRNRKVSKAKFTAVLPGEHVLRMQAAPGAAGLRSP